MINTLFRHLCDTCVRFASVHEASSSLHSSISRARPILSQWIYYIKREGYNKKSIDESEGRRVETVRLYLVKEMGFTRLTDPHGQKIQLRSWSLLE